MPVTRLLINSLSGGVGRQAPTKRLVTEAENLDNCLVTLEKSVEKRPPLTRIAVNGAGDSYLDFNVDVFSGCNPDNLFFYFLDIDGYNRYCIIINRAGMPFDPRVQNSFTHNGTDLNLSHFLTVYRIEPTEWIKEEVDITTGTTSGNTSGFNRGIYEYLTYGNKNTSSTYYIGSNDSDTVAKTSIKETFGATDFDVGMLLWNKLVPLDYLPNNINQDMVPNAANWYANMTVESNPPAAWSSVTTYVIGDLIAYNNRYFRCILGNSNQTPPDSETSNTYWYYLPMNRKIHSGDVVNYKISNKPENAEPSTEDSILLNNSPNVSYWKNVRDDVNFEINPDTLEELEIGQNRENFGEIPQYPAEEVYNDVRDLNGFKALRMLYDYYDKPRVISVSNPIAWSNDEYQLTSPLTAESRDGQTSYLGFGKVYFARNPYLTFPSGFYRATRYLTNPYFERVRSEGPNSVIDHRRLPILIYKDVNGDGKWRVKHMAVIPRRSGTSLSNPGPKAIERKERIKSATIWKSRLWIATENTIIASRTNSFFDFWVNDINNVVETDPIDIQASVGNYNQFSHIIPFQNLLFVLSSGSVQFEVRGGSNDVGMSPFNVELRPTSFFSTSKLNQPQKLGNNVFFTNSGKMFMYLSGSALSDEFSTSMDISTHCKGYLPENIGAITTSSATNSLFMVDETIPYHIYIFTFRTNGDKIVQNAYHRWIFSTLDNIVGCKTYEKDMYLVSKRLQGNNTKLCVYFCSLETVPSTTPMLDWLYKVPTSSISESGNNLIITLPHQDTQANYVVLASEWGTSAYTSIAVSANTTNGNNQTVLIVPRPGYTVDQGLQPIWVGRSYTMNIELSQQIKRGNDGVSEQALEGVLNLKRLTTRHLYTGSYDIKIQRQNRTPTTVTFFPTDINSMLATNSYLKIDTVGEHFSKILSYSEGTKIFIQSAYPTPCNISNIEILGTWRSRNTSIE